MTGSDELVPMIKRLEALRQSKLDRQGLITHSYNVARNIRILGDLWMTRLRDPVACDKHDYEDWSLFTNRLNDIATELLRFELEVREALKLGTSASPSERLFAEPEEKVSDEEMLPNVSSKNEQTASASRPAAYVSQPKR